MRLLLIRPVGAQKTLASIRCGGAERPGDRSRFTVGFTVAVELAAPLACEVASTNNIHSGVAREEPTVRTPDVGAVQRQFRVAGDGEAVNVEVMDTSR